MRRYENSSVVWLHIYRALVDVSVCVCVYSAQCGVRQLLLCVQCTARSETVIGVCTVHSTD